MNDLNLNELLQFSHVVEEHIEVTDADLIERIIIGTYDCGTYDTNSHIRSASRFTSHDIAMRVMEITLEKNQDVIDEWLKWNNGARTIIRATFSKPIGHGFVKGTSFKHSYAMHRCVIVLEADAHYRSYRIITAYPAPNKAVNQAIFEDRQNFYANRR